MHHWLTGSLQVEQLTIRIAGLDPALWGIRIAQLSDFHYDGLRLSDQLLEDAIAQCNRAKPDLVVLTGDFVTDDPTPIGALAGALATLQSQHGIYACLGNHDDAEPGARQVITAALTRVGIHVLWNAIAYPFGPLLPIVGLADYKSGEFDPAVLDALAPSCPRIVLCHNPDTARVLVYRRVDVQLSGHTHGGQINLPIIGNPIHAYFRVCQKLPGSVQRWLPYVRRQCHKVVRHWEWAQGLHRVGINQLYVNRGLGTYLPGRFRCSPELTLLTLEPAPLETMPG
ncbi:metallophosphoesterase [Leptolyngbya sp. AN02str]|uniref:metallophosphoesterase n=1 Tax=Leptolyngbya sp. AN02str TaxID=3423363 RepID=UPI003D321387